MEPPDKYYCEDFSEVVEKLFPSEELRQRHEEKTNKYCHVCETPLQTYYQMVRHKYIHSQNKLSTQNALLRNSPAGDKCICDKCGKSFSNVSNLNVHKKVHDQNYKPPVVRCQFCPDLKWNSRTGLKHHLKRFHENQTHLCDICGKNLATKGSLKHHMMTHTGEKPVVCPECQKGFMKKDNLNSHMRVHTKEKPFVCNFCQKAYAQNCSLRMHIRTVHERNLHACIVCSKSFNTKTLLNVHLQTHLDS